MSARIALAELDRMDADARKMKSDLHVADHVQKLTAALRAVYPDDVQKPTAEQAQTALAFLAGIDCMGTNGPAPENVQSVQAKALAVLERYLA